MTTDWVVTFFEDDEGCPVREFLDALDTRPRAKLVALIGRLKQHGPTLPFPYSSQVEGKLRELRTRFGNDRYRHGKTADGELRNGPTSQEREVMRKRTNWDRYYDDQMKNPETRKLVEDEVQALEIGIQLAKLRRDAGLTQTQLAAKVGMSAPNISRIESSPGQNLTLQTLVKLFGALDHEVTITPRKRSTSRRTGHRRCASSGPESTERSRRGIQDAR